MADKNMEGLALQNIKDMIAHSETVKMPDGSYRFYETTIEDGKIEIASMDSIGNVEGNKPMDPQQFLQQLNDELTDERDEEAQERDSDQN